MKPEAANIITGFRILCSIALLFCPTFSLSFIALYVIAGITDMIDGTVARKSNTVREFGAKLDSGRFCVCGGMSVEIAAEVLHSAVALALDRRYRAHKGGESPVRL